MPGLPVGSPNRAMSTVPTFSIVLATYNRAQVLSYAIRSVLAQTVDDWELLVVGDACTDDTESVVAGFGDPRIRFENLARNSGGQAAPNNRGLEEARGEIVAYLNHDDLFLPEHLERLRASLRETGADLAWSPVFRIVRLTEEIGPARPLADEIGLDGVVDENGFDPSVFVVASSVVATRRACAEIGPWLPERDLRTTPSQEWLFRGWRRGLRYTFHPEPTVIGIHGGARPRSYVRRDSPEHERAWAWIREGEAARSAMLRCVAVSQARDLYKAGYLALSESERLLEDVAFSRGVHPMELRRFFEGQDPGDYIRRTRRLTEHCEPLPVGRVVDAGTNAANAYLGRGWHAGEGAIRWTSLRVAELFFAIPEDEENGPFALRVRGHAHESDAEVSFVVGKRPILVRTFPTTEDVELPIPPDHSGQVHLEIRLERITSPAARTGSEDARHLGFCLGSLELVRPGGAGPGS